jgi:cysteine-rich repeat protein
MDQGEECDDGNNTDGDGCSADCKDEYCGDGTVQPGLNEECDDGNNTDGDGCSSTCDLETECGECKGKVTELSLRYLGENDAYIEVFEKAKKKGKKADQGPVVAFSGEVASGGVFDFNGSEGKDITLGTEISIYVDGVLNTKIHTSCSQPIGPGLIRGDFEVIEAISKDGGLICQPTTPSECECEGKVTELSLRYLGESDAYIKVYEKAKKKGKKADQGPVVAFSGEVASGEVFDFNGSQGKDITLGTEISIYVDGVLNTKIHTSCSQPIGPGLISGDFEVIEGSSKKGGRLCPL